MTLRRQLWLAVGALMGLSVHGFPGAKAAASEPATVDGTAVRFSAPEIGGAAAPRFILRSTLAFESRLEALADSTGVGSAADEGFLDRHVRAALERHIGEVLLSSLHIDPEPSALELERQTAAARMALLESIGGEQALRRAARAEGLEPREVAAVFRRRARASLYLHRMVAPMLSPNEHELRELHAAGPTRFRHMPFEAVRVVLERWVVARRLADAVHEFYRSARTRLRVTVLAGR